MTINYIDNVIELNCSGIQISDEENGIQILFSGENDLDYFLVQRHFDDEDYISEFYTEGCDTVGHWTFILVTLDKDTVTFSVDKMPIRVHLNSLPVRQLKQLRQTLKTMIGLIGKLIESDSQNR